MTGQLHTAPGAGLNQPQGPEGSLEELGRTECRMARSLSSVQLEAEQKPWQSVDPKSLWVRWVSLGTFG